MDHDAIGASLDVVAGGCENLIVDPVDRLPAMETS
jgi:hypothetical protein